MSSLLAKNNAAGVVNLLRCFLVGQVGLEPTMVKPADLQSAAIATRRLTRIW